MRFVSVLALAAAAWPAIAPAATAQENAIEQVERLPWLSPPANGQIAGVASISLSGDLRFLGPGDSKTFLQLEGNPPRENQHTLAPKSLHWFAVFDYDRSGYVRDDETIDPDALLATLKQQNEAGKAERRSLKLEVLTLEGWAVPPHYDAATRRLEWGTRLRGETGDTVANYTVRLLGREGVVEVILVSDMEELDENVRSFKGSLAGFSFNAGQKYEEFRAGDRTAEYGLAALIIGGAAAAAAKSGGFAALKGLGKLLGVAVLGGVAALFAFLKSLFRRRGPNA